MNGVKIGFAMCGSFCTIGEAKKQIENLVNAGADVYPIMSEIVYKTDNRFNKAEDLINDVEKLCGKKVIHTITGAEPIGPKKMLDIIVIAPCTGNTLAKIANGITDTPVTMAVKAHLRNNKPVLIAPATNDGLTASATNIGKLLNVKNIYFVPFWQDDAANKPTSLIADFSAIKDSVNFALSGKQIQPILKIK